MKTGVLLLAAGQSRRFGSDKRRALLADGQTLLDATVGNIRGSGLPLLVCLGDGDDGLARVLLDRDIAVVHCPCADAGMGHTLADGVRRRPREWDGIIVALADMPWVTAGSYRQIAGALSPDTIVLPCHGGRPGNPVGFGRRFFSLLEQLQGDTGAKGLLARFPAAVRRLDLEDPGIHRDVDTPATLAAGH